MSSTEIASKTVRRLDHEDALQALAGVQALLQRQRLVEELVHRQEEGDDRAPLVEGVIQRKHEAELRQLLADLHPADLAFILEALPLDERQRVWQLVPVEDRGDVLLETSESVRGSLIDAMDRESLIAAVETLDADELADLADDLPDDVVAAVHQSLTEAERARLTASMSYPDDSVGAIMDYDLVRVRDHVTVEVVLRYLRRLPELPDHTDQIFVVDRQERLKGTIYVTRLLISEPDTRVVDIMESDMLTLSPHDEAADAARAFERYDLVSAPVIDEQGRLIARVTVNDVLDVIREASEEQQLSQAGLHDEDIFAPVSRSVRNRMPWILINLLTAGTAAFIASRFEDTVSQIVILAFLMSIVAGIGGNSGNQTMTLVIRALATTHLHPNNIWRLVRRELTVTLLVGVCGSMVAALFAYAISGSVGLGAVMLAAMIINMLIGSIVGMGVPLLRARFGKDPAIGSSVLLTFATDSLGFLVFLGLASLFLL